MADAILFNGAAAFIAQEAGILDLLIQHKKIDPAKVKFVGGLSSGALMTFSFNATFSPNRAFTWEQFKDQFLFTLTSDKVYLKNRLPYDTSGLRDFLEDLTSKVNLHLIKDLPFESAILVTGTYNYDEKPLDPDKRVFWLTNIEEVAKKLPDTTDPETTVIAQQIKDHQLNIKLVNALLASTAIKGLFIQRKLFYKIPPDKSPNPVYELPIKYPPNKNGQKNDALFIDGGFSADPYVFANYREFFEVYGQVFDNIYVISPDNLSATIEAMKLIVPATQTSGEVTEEQEIQKIIIDTLLALENKTRALIKDLKDYNSGGKLANKIYYCTPQLDYSDPLDFNVEKKQYDDTLAWGESNPDKIALDISNIDDSDLVPLKYSI